MFKTKKKIVVWMIAFVFVLVPMTANANVVDDYYLDYAQPTCGASQGYISMVLRKNGQNYVHTWFWTVYALDGNQEMPCQMFCEFESGIIKFRPYVNTDYADNALIVLTHIDENGVFIPYSPRDISTGAPNWNYSINGYNLLGFKYGGNCLADWTYPQSYSFALFFAEDGSAIQLMQLQQQMQLDALDEMVAEQKKTNTWLEKILEAINGSSEQQKQEATNQGNSSVSQGEAAIEDKGAAFGDGITALTSSMSYTGTDCSWQFPQLKLPAISGVMDEVVLVESQPINFSQWVNAIPSDILLLIRSVLTIGLIVYCFKELYSTIAYVLTLRKDDNS